jgi:hypothetical protein
MRWARHPDSNSPKLPRFVRFGIPVIAAAAVIFITVLVMQSITGGGGTGHRWADPADKWGCSGARPTVVPSHAAVGQAFTLTSGSAHCAKPLPDGTTFEITVAPADGAGGRAAGKASVRSDGSFTVTLTVPEGIPPGDASVLVNDYDYVPCHDTGSAPASGMALVSCAAHQVRFTIVG